MFYSIRIGRNWRALGLWKGDTIEWFWIGSHEQYDEELLGATLPLSDSTVISLVVRVDGIEHDKKDPSLAFYNFSSRDPRSGAWQPICEPDYKG
jgi:hypothetical protein